MIKALVLFIGFFVFTACTSEQNNPYTTNGTKKVEDFQVPSFVFKTIEEKIKSEGVKDKPIYRRLDTTVILQATDKNILTHPKLRIKLSSDQNYIDLAQFVVGQGQFFFHIEPSQLEPAPPLEAFYFLSQAPQVQLQQTVYGIGCGKMADYTNDSKQFFEAKGIELSTEANQHLSLLVGDYIMVFREKNIVYMSHVQIRSDQKNFDKCQGGKSS